MFPNGRFDHLRVKLAGRLQRVRVVLDLVAPGRKIQFQDKPVRGLQGGRPHAGDLRHQLG